MTHILISTSIQDIKKYNEIEVYTQSLRNL